MEQYIISDVEVLKKVIEEVPQITGGGVALNYTQFDKEWKKAVGNLYVALNICKKYKNREDDKNIHKFKQANSKDKEIEQAYKNVVASITGKDNKGMSKICGMNVQPYISQTDRTRAMKAKTELCECRIEIRSKQGPVSVCSKCLRGHAHRKKDTRGCKGCGNKQEEESTKDR